MAGAALLLPAAAVALRVAQPSRLRRWMDGEPAPSGEVCRSDEARELAMLVEIASRSGIVRGTCLSRSLVLAWLLRRRGIASQVRIGVRRMDRGLAAHAWVECAGVPVNDTPEAIAAFHTLQPAAGRIAA